jgi:hypothetical protein
MTDAHTSFKDLTYICLVCIVRTEKKEPNQPRAAMGGNLLKYPDGLGTNTTTLLQLVTCCIEMNVKYNTVELCMYLHANSVYSHSYSALLDKGIHTKMKLLFCDDRRNYVLLRLKFVFMTFESRNDCICGTPTSTRPIIILPPLQNGIESALKNLT